ncbi:hypothetical protein MTO96_015884 [Rhipicephalus appendiculatus]
MAYTIVFRPSAGVNLAQYNDGELRAAVVANSGLHSAVAEEDLVCTNLPKNIFTVSTSCADRVANYAKIRELTLRGNKLAFHAYIAPPDGARPGIIYRAWNDESPQDLLRKLRRANPLLPIVQARDMGRTSRSVLIHFMAEELPPSVKMFGILYAVFNFRPKVEACLNWRQVGHRRDVCPLPNRLTCSSCGQKHPEAHPCTPQCVICGEAHMTGDRACKKRFQRGSSRPSRPRLRPQQEQQQQQNEFRLEKESFPSIHDGNRGNSSKSPGRNHGSKGKRPGRSASQSRDLGTQPGKVKIGDVKLSSDDVFRAFGKVAPKRDVPREAGTCNDMLLKLLGELGTPLPKDVGDVAKRMVLANITVAALLTTYELMPCEMKQQRLYLHFSTQDW